MPIPVKLGEVLNEMDVPDEEWTVYLNKRTGELVTVTPEEVGLVDDPSELEGAPDYLALPSKFEIHEWSILERFARSRSDEAHCIKLERAIHGRGAFRSFHDAIDDLGLRDEWYSFRDSALEDIAVSWLELNGIPFERGRRD